jgi:hypothetical protein
MALPFGVTLLGRSIIFNRLGDGGRKNGAHVHHIQQCLALRVPLLSQRSQFLERGGVGILFIRGACLLSDLQGSK